MKARISRKKFWPKLRFLYITWKPHPDEPSHHLISHSNRLANAPRTAPHLLYTIGQSCVFFCSLFRCKKTTSLRCFAAHRRLILCAYCDAYYMCIWLKRRPHLLILAEVLTTFIYTYSMWICVSGFSLVHKCFQTLFYPLEYAYVFVLSQYIWVDSSCEQRRRRWRTTVHCPNTAKRVKTDWEHNLNAVNMLNWAPHIEAQTFGECVVLVESAKELWSVCCFLCAMSESSEILWLYGSGWNGSYPIGKDRFVRDWTRFIFLLGE